jgi:AraC-like DNA-binding protein
MLRTAFKDFDEFAESIAGIEGRFVPTAPAAAEWWVQGAQTRRVSVQELQVGGCATFAGTGQRDCVALGLPMTDARRMRIDAVDLREDCFILMQGEQPFTFTGTGATRWAGITLPFDHPILDPCALEMLRASGTVRTRTQLECLAQLRALVNRALSHDSSVSFATLLAAEALEQDLSIAITGVLQLSFEDRDPRRKYLRSHHARALWRCLDLLQASPGRVLFVEDLVRAAGVCERSLRAIFQEYFGVSPMRLLKAKQLWEIRAALLAREPGQRVTRVAADLGIWDFSLFCRNYKALFGECPSDTVPLPGRPSRRNASMKWLIFAAKTFRAQAQINSRTKLR